MPRLYDLSALSHFGDDGGGGWVRRSITLISRYPLRASIRATASPVGPPPMIAVDDGRECAPASDAAVGAELERGAATAVMVVRSHPAASDVVLSVDCRKGRRWRKVGALVSHAVAWSHVKCTDKRHSSSRTGEACFRRSGIMSRWLLGTRHQVHCLLPEQRQLGRWQVRKWLEPGLEP